MKLFFSEGDMGSETTYNSNKFYGKLYSKLKRNNTEIYELSTVWYDKKKIVAESKIVFYEEKFRFKFEVVNGYKRKGIMTYIFCSYIIFIIKNYSKFSYDGRIKLMLVEANEALDLYKQTQKSVYEKILFGSSRKGNCLEKTVEVNTWKKRQKLIRYYKKLKKSKKEMETGFLDLFLW